MKGITLIGMPGVGKSTIGPQLASQLGWQLYDTDEMMVQEKQKPLEQIVAESSQEEFMHLEAAVINRLDLRNCIVATGGSVIYGTTCHAKIKRETWVVWLYASLGVIQERLNASDFRMKRILGIREAGLEKLFQDREPLYRALADYKVSTAHRTPQVVIEEIVKAKGDNNDL